MRRLFNLLLAWLVYRTRSAVTARTKDEIWSEERWFMNGKTNRRPRHFTAFLVTSVALLCTVLMARAQTPATPASRFLGTVTAIEGTNLTVKTDAGEVHQVDVPSSASIKRIAPGQKDLSTAVTIQFSELATGDRVLVKLDPSATGSVPQAAQIIAVKQEDVA